MITAAEARSLISLENNDNKERIREDIDKKLEEAIKADKDWFELEYELDEDISKELEKLGYTVCPTNGHGWDDHTIVKFGRNKKIIS